MREGNKRSIFVNVADICKKMRRQPEHVIQFLFAELGTTGSVDASSRLVIKGRFQQKQIENVLRRYIGQYLPPPKHAYPNTESEFVQSSTSLARRASPQTRFSRRTTVSTLSHATRTLPIGAQELI